MKELITKNFNCFTNFDIWKNNQVLEKIRYIEFATHEFLKSKLDAKDYKIYKLKLICYSCRDIFIDCMDILVFKYPAILDIPDSSVANARTEETRTLEKWKKSKIDYDSKLYHLCKKLYSSCSKYIHLRRKQKENIENYYFDDLQNLLIYLKTILWLTSTKVLNLNLSEDLNIDLNLYNDSENFHNLPILYEPKIQTVNNDELEQIKLEPVLKPSFEKLCLNKNNIFLTGDAGTGKTTLLRFYINQYLKSSHIKYRICATTGMAAHQLDKNSTTLHRLFRIPVQIGQLANENKLLFSINDYNDLKKQSENEEWDKLINKLDFLQKGCDLIVIDEISMCRIDVFENISRKLQLINLKRSKPIQIIICGDFYQLPPVCTEEDEEILDKIYGRDPEDGFTRIYAFESKYWQYWGFDLKSNQIYLTKPIRQQHDRDYFNFLNIIKQGRDHPKIDDAIKYFNSKLISEQESLKIDAIRLFARNSAVDLFNARMLETVKNEGNIRHYEAYLDEDLSNAIKNNEISIEELEQKTSLQSSISLRKNAYVMFLKNDLKNNKYRNGDSGIVYSLYDDLIFIQKDNEIIHLPRCVEEIYDKPIYVAKTQEIKHKCIGTIKQFPLKLFYAMTIHKSQGHTFPNIVYDPKPNGHREVEKGLIYVALSRVKGLQGLNLLNPIKKDYLQKSNRVFNLYKQIKNNI